jgi:hypothetical protein
MSLWENRSGVLWFKNMCLGVKLTRSGLVIVNLDCQFDWVEKHLRD